MKPFIPAALLCFHNTTDLCSMPATVNIKRKEGGNTFVSICVCVFQGDNGGRGSRETEIIMLRCSH